MDDTAAPQPLLATAPQPVRHGGSMTRRGIRMLLFVVGSLLLSFVLFVMLSLLVTGLGIQTESSLPPVVVILLALLTFGVALLAHELGHALAARWVNWQLLAIGVGPLSLRRTAGGLRLGRNPFIRSLGGFVYAIPRDERHLRRRRLAVVAGGPAASVLLTLLPITYLVNADGDGLLATAAYLLGSISFFFAVLTLAPYRSGGLTSDGGQMLQLLRGGPSVEQRLAVHLLLTALLGGVRPRDLDEKLMARALAMTNETDAVAGHSIAYWRDLDRGDIAGAAAHLDYTLAHRALLPPFSSAGLAAEAAFLTARYDLTADAVTTAAAWLQLAAPTAHSAGPTYRRAEAAVHLAAGRAAAARVAADTALRQLDRALDSGGAIAEREWLLAMRDAAIAGEEA